MLANFYIYPTDTRIGHHFECCHFDKMSEGDYETIEMPLEIDFSKSVPNPYVGKVRRRVTINIDDANIEYFKAEATRTGAPYQTKNFPEGTE